MAVTKHLFITGRVQGVGYRMSLLYAAQKYNVNGWVRNKRDGSVEAMLQGDAANVQAVIDWAHKGPGLSQVDNVDVSEGSGDYSSFEIADTQ